MLDPDLLEHHSASLTSTFELKITSLGFLGELLSRVC